jgi:transcriptional regulator with XRE-family HTH domain
MNGSPPNRKALLRQRNRTLKELARRLGVSLGHVSRVVSGERHSPRIERAVARALGLSLREAFPEWYGRGEDRAA